jgi:hypothetical protein
MTTIKPKVTGSIPVRRTCQRNKNPAHNAGFLLSENLIGYGIIAGIRLLEPVPVISLKDV